MKKIVGLAMLASAAVAGTAHAEGSFSGNVALTTDYVFRGVSQTQNAPAIQGGFDYTNGIFYAGTWASNVDFGNSGGIAFDAPMELDLYFGVTPTTGPVSWNLGVLGYFYPGAADNGTGVEFDYVEFKVAPSIEVAPGFTLGAALYYSPEFTVSTDSATYYELNGAYAINDMFSVSGAYGYQTSDQTGYFVTTSGAVDDYSTWNLGVTASVAGFDIDLRYTDADEDITNLAGEVVSDGKAVLTLKRAL
ncbi:MAG: TorF family putative porin [Hyphomonadaceae bacterium]